jgi:enoyl-CoA hydratase
MTVHTSHQGPVTVITIDRLNRRNAIDGETTLALDEAFNSFEDDPDSRVAVLTGGPDVFCAGTDIVAWAGPPTPRGGPYGIAGRRLIKPVIAAVEGVAAGGGFEIALATTMIVASRTASFAFPEVTLGLVAECGGLFRAPRALPLNVAHEMLLTGQPLSAERAHHFGVVNRVVEPGSALQEAVSLAHHIAALAPLAVRESLATVTALHQDADELGWKQTARAKKTVRESADAVEGVAAFKERRPARWSGR